MNTVTIGVASREEVNARFMQAMTTGDRQGAFRSFENDEQLWRILTAKRWALLKAMTGAGPMSLREAARRVGRDVKGVHSDVHALISAGLIDKTEDGKIEFPFDAIHVDFVLKAA
ncbi:MAG: hypothetical protein PHE55_16190 [Methylococcaceae bacterium]|nr:hypothetical protein [Methylococcaceae bacterium]